MAHLYSLEQKSLHKSESCSFRHRTSAQIAMNAPGTPSTPRSPAYLAVTGMPATESHCSACVVSLNTALFLHCNTVKIRGQLAGCVAHQRPGKQWVSQLVSPAGLELCENRSASNTSIQFLQQSNTLATAARTQKVPKTGCLSKLPRRSREDCSASKILLPVQPASGCSPLHNAQSLASVWGSDFLTLTSTADKDSAMLACSAPTTAPYLFHSLQPCCADTKAFAFVPGHVIPHSMLTRDMTWVGGMLMTGAQSKGTKHSFPLADQGVYHTLCVCLSVSSEILKLQQRDVVQVPDYPMRRTSLPARPLLSSVMYTSFKVSSILFGVVTEDA